MSILRNVFSFPEGDDLQPASLKSNRTIGVNNRGEIPISPVGAPFSRWPVVNICLSESFLPQQGLGHRLDGHRLQAALQPDWAVLQTGNRCAEIARQNGLENAHQEPAACSKARAKSCGFLRCACVRCDGRQSAKCVEEMPHDPRVSLSRGLASTRLLCGPNFELGESLKALVYFNDGDLKTLTDDEKRTFSSSLFRRLCCGTVFNFLPSPFVKIGVNFRFIHTFSYRKSS